MEIDIKLHNNTVYFICFNSPDCYSMLLSIKDTILIGICNSLTSLYAGLVVFGVVGFISVQTGTDIDKVYSIEKRARTNIMIYIYAH